MDLMGFPLALFADASAAGNAMQSYIKPVMMTIIAISSLAVVFFLVNGGIQYMTSSGNPERLEHAKKIIRNALIGLALVIAAGFPANRNELSKCFAISPCSSNVLRRLNANIL